MIRRPHREPSLPGGLPLHGKGRSDPAGDEKRAKPAPPETERAACRGRSSPMRMDAVHLQGGSAGIVQRGAGGLNSRAVSGPGPGNWQRMPFPSIQQRGPVMSSPEQAGMPSQALKQDMKRFSPTRELPPPCRVTQTAACNLLTAQSTAAWSGAAFVLRPWQNRRKRSRMSRERLALRRVTAAGEAPSSGWRRAAGRTRWGSCPSCA